MSSDVKWIKITTDIFDDEKILLIESLPESDAIIVCWFKLLCFAGKMNNSGVFLMNDRIAYTEKMLATIFRMKETTVQLALETFQNFGMIEIIDGVITIPNWNKHQSLDAYEKKKERDRIYQAERRATQKALIDKSSDKSSDSLPSDMSDVAFSEREEDKEREKEENNNIYYDKIIAMYNEICVSLPSVRAVSEARKKAIRARLNTYSVDDFKRLFEMAEESDFLKGKNNTNWMANFDWLLKDANMAKVLDGNYKNRGQTGSIQKINQPSFSRPSKAQELDDFYKMSATFAAEQEF